MSLSNYIDYRQQRMEEMLWQKQCEMQARMESVKQMALMQNDIHMGFSPSAANQISPAVTGQYTPEPNPVLLLLGED